MREQFALGIEDVLARRHRALFLDAAAAIDVAPEVARLMAEELGMDAQWQVDQVAQFTALANSYRCTLDDAPVD